MRITVLHTKKVVYRTVALHYKTGIGCLTKFLSVFFPHCFICGYYLHGSV